MPRLSGIVTVGCDVLLVALSAAMLFVLLTGGGVFVLAGTRISVTSTGNPLTFFLVLGFLRWWLGRTQPFLGFENLRLDTLDRRAVRFCHRLTDWLQGLTKKDAIRLVSATVAASLLIRLSNAYWHYGFFAGDDVEVHEMTLAVLSGHDWGVWDLRNAFYPMTFIFPVQWLLSRTGVSDTATLVFAGRAVVAAFSSMTLVLLFIFGRRALGTPSAVLAVMFLAGSALHVTLGSTELPRPVAAFFLVLGFGLMLRENVPASVGTGLALGIAGAMRFSEAVFILPCVVGLLTMRRWLHAAITTLTFICSGLVILGVSDWLYWGSAFSSLAGAVDYTVVKGLSSRGYQPFHYYLSHIPRWSDFFTVGLGLLAFRFRISIPALWAWIPVLVLSFLRHKEPRYLVPVLPFLALAAGATLWEILQRLDAESAPQRRLALGLVVAGCAAAVFELSGFRFPRSERSVDLAILHRAEWSQDGAAVEQLWRVGGRLYLPDARNLLDIAPEQLRQPHFLQKVASDPALGWVLLQRESLRPEHLETLRRAGYTELPTRHETYHVFGLSENTRGSRAIMPPRPSAQ